MRAHVESPIPAYGSAQGIIHSWFKEAQTPYFNFRELSTSNLIKVEYGQGKYQQVANAIQERNMVLLIAGECAYDRVSRTAIRMKLDKIAETVALSTTDFDKLFGSFPDFYPVDFAEEAAE